MEPFSRIVFALASIALMALAAALVFYSMGQVWRAAASGWEASGTGLLEAVGYVVIAVAVFDVGKYLFQEEVVRGREMRAPSEARRSLTSFISTIAIAIFLEALVSVFAVSKGHVPHMIYPTMLLVAGVFLILGLGVYQWLSVQVERAVKREGDPEDQQSGKQAAPVRADNTVS